MSQVSDVVPSFRSAASTATMIAASSRERRAAKLNTLTAPKTVNGDRLRVRSLVSSMHRRRLPGIRSASALA